MAIKLGDEQKKAIQEDYDSGMTYAKIAQKHGMSQSAVWRVLTVRERGEVVMASKLHTLPDNF